MKRAVGILLAAVTLITAQALPASAAPGTVTADAVQAALPAQAQQQWTNLSLAQKNVTLEILNDDRFGLPAEADSMQAEWPALEVVEKSEAVIENEVLPDPWLPPTSTPIVITPFAAAAKTYDRLNTFTQWWGVFGIRYTELSTTVGYRTNNGRVLNVNRCYGHAANYVPLRAIAGASWNTKTSTTATCKTEWKLSRPLQRTVTGVQGLTVDGSGRIVNRWKLP